jgi:hypothetical protein
MTQHYELLFSTVSLSISSTTHVPFLFDGPRLESSLPKIGLYQR